jgi:sodium/proline symporter
MPHILVLFMGIEKPSMIKKASTVAIIWVILTLGAASAIAILGRTYLLSDGTSLAALLLPDNRKAIFITVVEDLYPGFIAGLMLAAIIAAAMSTADSQLLVASSSFASDLYKPLIRKNKASDKEVGWVSRLVVVIVAVVAYFIASSGSEWASDIMAMVENAWGLFGAAFGPVVILSLFWKRFNFSGAFAGIVAGAVTDGLWLVFLTAKTGIYEILPGFVVGMIAAVVVTLVTKAPGAEVEAIFARATDAEIDD